MSLFNSDDSKITEEQQEKAFIDKLGKFAGACINSRYNGTIYFGVADSKDGISKHGQIEGVNISPSLAVKFEEWIEKHFRKNPISLKYCTTEEKMSFSSCVSSLHIIPILNTERIVMEIDVEPKFENTKFLKFKVNSPKYPDGVYFVRKGSCSIPLTPAGGKEEKEFLNVSAQIAANHRQQLESYKFQEPVDLQQKLKKLLCKGELRFLDNQYQYFLVVNRFCTAECCKMFGSEDLNWIKLINWRAIFDFDPDTSKDGTLSLLQKVLMKPHEISGTMMMINFTLKMKRN